MNKIIMLIITEFLVVTFTACGSGGGSDSPSSSNTITTKTGQFMDSAVEGLIYECKPTNGSVGSSGTTNELGEYSCGDGDSVSFYISNIFLAEVNSSEYITPQMLFPNSDRAVVNLTQLLQTLDENKNPADGIKLDARLTANFVTSNFNLMADDFDSNMENILGLSLVDADTAIEHLNDTFSIIGIEIVQYDTIKPVVTINGEVIEDKTVITKKIVLNQSIPEDIIVSTDAVDGVLSIYKSGSLNVGQLGEQVVIIRSTDLTGNTFSAIIQYIVEEEVAVIIVDPTENNETNTTIIVDIVPPVSTVIGQTFESFVGEDINIRTVIFVDAIDGNITAISSGSVNKNVVGTYIVNKIASDLSGNTSSITDIYIVKPVPDTTAPVLSSTDKSFTTTVGTALTFETVTTDDGSAVVVTGSVDFNTAGTYTRIYNSTDEAGNKSITVTHTYVVNEVVTDSPIIVSVIDENLSVMSGQDVDISTTAIDTDGKPSVAYNVYALSDTVYAISLDSGVLTDKLSDNNYSATVQTSGLADDSNYSLVITYTGVVNGENPNSEKTSVYDMEVIAIDDTPDAMDYQNIYNASLSSYVFSDTKTVSGTNIDITASITNGGTVIVNGVTTNVSSYTVRQGDTVQFYLPTSSSYSSVLYYTASIGTITDSISVTTTSAPTPPPPAPLTPQETCEADGGFWDDPECLH